ncbi:uncharacterized protein METZ01_LOCUS462303, partial [marine metagenome]
VDIEWQSEIVISPPKICPIQNADIAIL